MLIDLINTSNYVSYNIKLAQLLGLKEAIYLSELLNINDKAIRKNEINFSDIALNLGITNEELASILIQPDKSTGSEVMLVADNVKKKVNK